jgi:cytoskeletal protein CcmA (bactofilin family)
VVHGDISYGSIAVEHGARLLGLVIQNPSGGNNAGDAANSAIRQAQTSK